MLSVLDTIEDDPLAAKDVSFTFARTVITGMERYLFADLLYPLPHVRE